MMGFVGVFLVLSSDIGDTMTEREGGGGGCELLEEDIRGVCSIWDRRSEWYLTWSVLFCRASTTPLKSNEDDDGV